MGQFGLFGSLGGHSVMLRPACGSNLANTCRRMSASSLGQVWAATIVLLGAGVVQFERKIVPK